MWEKLIHRRDLKRSGVELDQIEDPFFAVGRVRRYLEGYEHLPGLDELISAFCGRGQSRRSIPEPQARRMFEAVERGDWLLVLDKPVLPLSRDSANRWWAITGKRVLESVYHPPRVPEKPSLSWVEYTPTRPKPDPVQKQYHCTFTKPRTLPDGAIDFTAFGGPVPTCGVTEYGTFALLGGDETNPAGNIVLKQIRGNPLPAALGTLALGGSAAATAGVSCGGLCGAGAVASTVGASALAGLVGLLWPSSLGDSSLYTDEQLNSLKQGRTRIRLHIEQQADGTLKGYGYNTQQRSDWEMIPVVQFKARGAEQVADFGDGVTLIWTPAVDPSATSGIPPLEGGPQAPKIWIYPPTEQADSLIVNPIHPPEYKDFILVFPAGSGVRPLYVVMNVRRQPGMVTGWGQEVSGVWLSGAGVGLGAPIPARIADQLRGKSFKNFNKFREAFWMAVGSDPDLSKQFNHSNRARMLEGMAPRARAIETVGNRRSYELHHGIPISDGGEVYGVDNLSVTTPEHHIDIHRITK